MEQINTFITRLLSAPTDIGTVDQLVKKFGKLKELIAAIPWYYKAAFGTLAFTCFLPSILNKINNWIKSLRSARQDLKATWSDGLNDRSSELVPSESDCVTNHIRLENSFNKLEAELNKLKTNLITIYISNNSTPNLSAAM